MSGDPTDLHYEDGTHRTSPARIATHDEFAAHEAALLEHLAWHNRNPAPPPAGAEVKVRDAIVTARPPEDGVDRGERYTIEAHGVRVEVRTDAANGPRIHITDLRMPPVETAILVSVGDEEPEPHGELAEGLVPVDHAPAPAPV